MTLVTIPQCFHLRDGNQLPVVLRDSRRVRRRKMVCLFYSSKTNLKQLLLMLCDTLLECLVNAEQDILGDSYVSSHCIPSYAVNTFILRMLTIIWFYNHTSHSHLIHLFRSCLRSCSCALWHKSIQGASQCTLHESNTQLHLEIAVDSIDFYFKITLNLPSRTTWMCSPLTSRLADKIFSNVF